ncbi:ABC transporter substrate-binding protein [Candidatus Aerophobetes bacterium]|uniref:ABC transporter substrate-binding protein n=1 Tax=Aerophobetes bacterium TaxID=2030807 RepID=A0A497E554_UNCAE|nr:MAG: ABC transporter substrate-binding protein [Candidatus Aerophobetes bacterium]
MMKKIMVMILVGAICLMGATTALAQKEYVPGAKIYSTLAEYEKFTGKKIEKFHEAPMLRVKVAAGELPPVEERLPEEPMVIEPYEEIGQYGGTWHRAWLGLADMWGPAKLMEVRMIQWNWNANQLLPDVAKAWEVSKDGRSFTFYLRKGIKWSDGHPFTTEDIRFEWEDVILNKELTPARRSAWFYSGGEPGKLEIIDDYTFRITFKEPYPIFLLDAPDRLRRLVNSPKHYGKQFHPRYTPADKLEKMTKEAGFDHWWQLFLAKMGEGWWDTNPDHPTLWAWKLKVPGTATRMIHERNPYYWKVDPQGNQLPYIDRITHDLVEDPDMINFKAVAGEIDMQMRHIQFANYTLLMENREKGDYRVLKWKNDMGSDPTIYFNLTCKDPVLRKLFENDKFRKALSLAINRDEINEFCYLGTGEPRQESFISGTRYYSEEWEKAYAEYDPEKANALLDEIGLKWDKDHKYRLRPDGKPLALTIEFTPAFGPWPDACELIKGYWEAVGVKTSIKPEERSLFWTRIDANEHQVVIWTGMCSAIVVENIGWLTGYTASEYDRWYKSGGEAGEKPTGDIAKLYELWDKLKVTTDEKERERLVKEIVNLHIKNIWMIGTVGETIQPVVVKNYFRNVPEKIICANPQQTPGNAQTSQFFIKVKK